jgi:hypothetical protein
LFLVLKGDFTHRAARMTPAQRQLAQAQRKAKNLVLESLFSVTWPALRGPELAREVVFAPPWKWRFDFAFEKNCTIELEGGIWTVGRHVRGAGFQADLEKYWTAMTLGWRVFRLSGAMLKPRYIEPIIDLCQ